MARKVVNRKELREEFEAAERAGIETEAEPKKKPAARAPAKRKSRAKEPVDVRMRVFWGVFNQAMKPVAMFEHNQKKAAEKKAAALTQSGKTPHFVQKVKQVIDEN
jgi:hypothetical protein